MVHQATDEDSHQQPAEVAGQPEQRRRTGHRVSARRSHSDSSHGSAVSSGQHRQHGADSRDRDPVRRRAPRTRRAATERGAAAPRPPRPSNTAATTVDPTAPTATAAVMIVPAAVSDTPRGSSSACSQVIRAMNTPKPRKASTAIRRSTGSVHTRAQLAGLGRPRPGRSSGERRRTTRKAAAATTATAASPTISATQVVAAHHGARPEGHHHAEEQAGRTRPRCRSGADRSGSTATTPVIALSTNGWATATSSCPASAQPKRRRRAARRRRPR